MTMTRGVPLLLVALLSLMACDQPESPADAAARTNAQGLRAEVEMALQAAGIFAAFSQGLDVRVRQFRAAHPRYPLAGRCENGLLRDQARFINAFSPLLLGLAWDAGDVRATMNAIGKEAFWVDPAQPIEVDALAAAVHQGDLEGNLLKNMLSKRARKAAEAFAIEYPVVVERFIQSAFDYCAHAYPAINTGL